MLNESRLMYSIKWADRNACVDIGENMNLLGVTGLYLVYGL